MSIVDELNRAAEKKAPITRSVESFYFPTTGAPLLIIADGKTLKLYSKQGYDEDDWTLIMKGEDRLEEMKRESPPYLGMSRAEQAAHDVIDGGDSAIDTFQFFDEIGEESDDIFFQAGRTDPTDEVMVGVSDADVAQKLVEYANSPKEIAALKKMEEEDSGEKFTWAGWARAINLNQNGAYRFGRIGKYTIAEFVG